MIFIALGTWAAAAGPEATIEAALRACLARPEGQTTIGMIDCENAAGRSWDTELNRVYQSLMSNLDAAGKKKLEAIDASRPTANGSCPCNPTVRPATVLRPCLR